MADPEIITILSLCTGYGGLELGLARALENPLRVVAVEIEAFALANLVAKAEENKLAVEALWPDLRTFPAERFRGCFDFILAGYPCQPFSVAGKRQGKDDPRHLWPHIARIVQAVRPVWCFFENVPGHLSIGFPEVYRSLRNMGFKVEGGLFTAAECNAPHKRQRLFVLAYDSSGRRRTRGTKLKRFSKQTTFEYGCDELANTEYGRPQNGRSQSNAKIIKQRIRYNGATIAQLRPLSPENRWPARPGQPQYEWEEPRVVSDACNGGWGKLLQQKQKCGGNVETNTRSKSKISMEGQAQSRLGGAVDGLARSRVDRLRLLGNGVVPQQAEKAFRKLMGKFER